MLPVLHDRQRAKDAAVLGIARDGKAALPTVCEYTTGAPFSCPTVVGAARTQVSGEPFAGMPGEQMFAPARKPLAARSGDLTMEAPEDYLARSRQ